MFTDSIELAPEMDAIKGDSDERLLRSDFRSATGASGKAWDTSRQRRGSGVWRRPLLPAAVLLCSAVFAGTDSEDPVSRAAQAGSSLATVAPALIPATGQLATFATGDDGDLRLGVPWPSPRFTDHGDGTVTDQLTGLMWSRDAHLDATAGGQTWEGALALVAGLNDGSIGGFTDWRLPNINELESLVDYDQFSHALPRDHPFLNVQPEAPVPTGAEPRVSYWSSTPFVNELAPVIPAAAKSKSFQSGSTFPQSNDPDSGPKLHVWAVRGGAGGLIMLPRTGWNDSFAPGDDGDMQAGVAWPSPRFEVVPDATGALGNVVVDHLTGLIWSRDAGLIANANWNNALANIQAMNVGSGTFGFTDWRLPNARELRSIVDYSRFEPPLIPSHPFVGVQPILYWSSTTFAGNTQVAGLVSMEVASDLRSFELKSGTFGVWAVRSRTESDVLIMPASLDFGDVIVGQSAPPQTVTLENTGTADLNLGALTLSGANAGDFALGNDLCTNQIIAPAATCTFDVTLTPSATGVRSAQVNIPSNAPTSPDAVPLTGAGVQPLLGLIPTGLDFGDVVIGGMALQMLVVENTGTGTLEPGAITLSGAQAGDFSIEINNCAGVQLSSGESCVVDIGFTPGAPGIRRATLRLESNAATSPDTVDLIGTNNMVFFDGFEDR